MSVILSSNSVSTDNVSRVGSIIPGCKHWTHYLTVRVVQCFITHCKRKNSVSFFDLSVLQLIIIIVDECEKRAADFVIQIDIISFCLGMGDTGNGPLYLIVGFDKIEKIRLYHYIFIRKFMNLLPST